MNITIHGGAARLGGTCIEVSDGSVRILLDFGIPLTDSSGQPFSFDRRLSGPELAMAGVLPDVKGVYEWDASQPVDAVFISHPHFDHFGFIPYIRRDIPIIAGKAAGRLIQLSLRLSQGATRELGSFENATPVGIGRLMVTPLLVDHSAFDSYGFVIEGGGRRVIYTGDFRNHGRKQGALRRFLDAADGRVDALLLDGTHVGGHSICNPHTESEIEKGAAALLENSRGPVLICSSSQDIDRIVSFYRAALAAGKLFIVDAYTALVLETVGEFARIPCPSRGHRNLKVMFPPEICRNIVRELGKESLRPLAPHKISRDALRKLRNRIVMTVRPSSIRELERLGVTDDGLFVYSLWEGYRSFDSMKRLLDFVESRGMQCHTLHTSGHAGIPTLERVAQRLKPTTLIPIHTLHPEEHKSLGAPVTLLSSGRSLAL